MIGFVQDWRADRALAALQQLAAAARHGAARRAARRCCRPARLVPGDIVLLEAGNLVPADLRLIEIAQLQVDESALTGESVTVDKHTARAARRPPRRSATGSTWPSRARTATHGRGRGLVVATGMATELGQVAGLLDRAGDRSTPLQQRLAAFGKRLALGGAGDLRADLRDRRAARRAAAADGR